MMIPDDDADDMQDGTPEEVDAYLLAHGYDPEKLVAFLRERIQPILDRGITSVDYEWEEYRIGYADGEQDRVEHQDDEQWKALGTPRDDQGAYWDGYHDGYHEWSNKYNDPKKPHGEYRNTEFAGRKCRFRFMGKDWREGTVRRAIVRQGKQIGWAIDYDHPEDGWLRLYIYCQDLEVSA